MDKWMRRKKRFAFLDDDDDLPFPLCSVSLLLFLPTPFPALLFVRYGEALHDTLLALVADRSEAVRQAMATALAEVT